MGRKNTKGTQKINPIIDASVESPPYETALGMTNTEEMKRGKEDKQVDLHSCKCKNKNNKNVRKRTRTWESIKELYGDADTTEVWDNRQQKPKVVFSPKLHKKENPKKNIDESENNDDVIYPTSNFKNTKAKLSLIGLYRKNKNNRNKIKIGQVTNENSMDTDVISSPYPKPKVKFMLGKKSKKDKSNYIKSNYTKPNYATGDICTQGPCREALENLYHLQGLTYNPNQQDKITYNRTKSGYTSKKEKNKTKTLAKENKIMKKSKNKQIKAIKTTKGGNVGYGDQISPIPLKNRDVKDVLSKYSFVVKKMGHTICKCKNNNGSKFQTDGDQSSPISLKKKDLQDLQCNCSFIDKLMGHTICKCKNNNGTKFQTDGDQISPISFKKEDLQDLQCKCSFIGKMLGHTICKCKNNNGSTLQTSRNVNNENNRKEKRKTKTIISESKIIKKSKNKQVKAIKATKGGNVGYGDQISPIPLKNQDEKYVESKYSFIGKMMGHTICKCKNNGSKLQTDGDKISPIPLKRQDLQCKCSFFDKMMGHTICKCKNNNESTLQTATNVNNDNIQKETIKIKSHTKENKIIKKPKKKQAKSIKITKDGNVGHGDQIPPIPLKNRDRKDVLTKYSSIGKMVRHTICKCKNNNGSTLQTSSNVNDQTVDPLLKMKVNLTDMRVINSSEVNEKIRKLGRTEKHMSCICPSRINREVCDGGPCEKALKNPHTHFNCKCRKENIIECKDSTCDLKIRDIKVRSRKKNKPQPSVYNKDKKPLFEVMLDPAKMKIINSNELRNVIKQASQDQIICPNGICNTMTKQGNVSVNCKCVGKKMTPYINECEERTCRDEEHPQKRCKLSYLCSRVFSKSETWTGQERNRKRRPIRGNGYGTNIGRNGVIINLPRDRTPKTGTYVGGRLSDVWCRCFCECNEKKPDKEKLKKTLNKKKSNQNKRRRRRKGFFRKKKKDSRTLTEKILDCLEREQEECEYKVIKKSKEYKKNEKKAIKENKKKVAEQKKAYKTNQHHWSCFTNFISGLLNVGFESVRTVFKIAFSLIADPISSYIYVREKIKNPPATIIRIIQWFVRTWRNKSSAIAKAVEDSTKLKVIADQIEDSAVYNALGLKSKTPEYEKRARMRKRRMQKRHDEALYGCRHMMLTTMRKTPCLWFYHICPDLYPQCLGLLQFMNNFLHVILYCGAIMCWTPCIVACEMCRACMCCFFCTN